jgi:ribonuclease HII
MPDFTLECRIGGPVAGVDEVGRGPLAGPVYAAAVILDPARLPTGLDDSKKMTELRREKAFDAIMASALEVGIGVASVEEIDRINILAATMLAMRRAVDGLSIKPVHALIDGNKVPALPCPAEAIVKGDGKILSIAAASIIAKVTRDRVMNELDVACRVMDGRATRAMERPIISRRWCGWVHQRIIAQVSRPLRSYEAAVCPDFLPRGRVFAQPRAGQCVD